LKTGSVEEPESFSKEMKVFGVYPAHPYRATFREQVELGAATSPPP